MSASSLSCLAPRDASRADRTGSQQFLFRPRPMQDESLSSWRQRAGIENGFSIYPRHRRETLRTDPDRVEPHTADWLAATHALSVDKISALTLSSDKLRSAESAPMQWLVPLRYTKTAVSFGPVACSGCLEGDPYPYFRLYWRYAFITSCPIHDLKMLDRCKRCCGLLWPHTAVKPDLYRGRQTRIHECARCGDDLRASGRCKADGSLARRLLRSVGTGRMDLSSVSIQMPDFMDGLAFVTQLFIWRPSATRLWPTFSRHSAASKVTNDTRTVGVERLDVETRHEVLERSASLLLGWPESFFAAMAKSRLSWQHISGIGRDPPLWMAGLVREHMSRQRRGITLGDVSTVVSRLEDAGLRPSKASVARTLGCHEAKAIQAVLGKRQTATRAELACLIECLALEAARAQRRRSSLAVQARDCAMVAHWLLNGRQSAWTDVSTPAKLLRALERASAASGESRSVAEIGIGCVKLWLIVGKELWDTGPESPFRGVRSSKVPARAATDMLRRCMTGLDRRLERDPSVFWESLKEST